MGKDGLCLTSGCATIVWMFHEWSRGEYVISTDPARLDLDVIYTFLSTQSYWGRERPREVVERSMQHSLPFGLYLADRQIGFCRVVTDYATFAWLADVFVLEEFRGRKLGEWLVQTAVEHPDLQGLRRWLLATRDAHDLYLKYGFKRIAGSPTNYMIRQEERP